MLWAFFFEDGDFLGIVICCIFILFIFPFFIPDPRPPKVYNTHRCSKQKWEYDKTSDAFLFCYVGLVILRLKQFGVGVAVPWTLIEHMELDNGHGNKCN